MRMKAQDMSFVEDDTELKDLQLDCDAVAFYLNDRFYRIGMSTLADLITGPDIPEVFPEYESPEDIPEFGRQGIVYPCSKHEGVQGGLASVNEDFELFNFGATGMPQAVCELGDIRSIVSNPATSARVFQLVDTGVLIPAIASWKAVMHLGNYTGGAGLACTVGPVKLYRVIAARLGSRPDRKNIPREGPKCKTVDNEHFNEIKQWLKPAEVKEREVKRFSSRSFSVPSPPPVAVSRSIVDTIRRIPSLASFISQLGAQMTEAEGIDLSDFADRYNKLPSDVKWSDHFALRMDEEYGGVRNAWLSELKMGELTVVQYAREIGLQDWVTANDPQPIFAFIQAASADDAAIRYPRHSNYPADLVAKMDAMFGRSGWLDD
jgi:hypothetical protein